MLMAIKDVKSKDLKKEHDNLVREALKLPGVADLMAVYKRIESPYRRSQQYLETIRPVFFLSNTDNSGQL